MKLLTSIWVVLLVAIGLFYIRVQDPIPIQMLRLKTFDALQLRQEVDKSEDIALINIGYDSLKALGQFPWPRTHFAQIISDIRDKGAGIIAFTMIFSEEDRYGGDEVFASWIKDNGVVLSQTVSGRVLGIKGPHVGIAIIGEDPLDFVFHYNGLLINTPQLIADGHGIAAGSPEVDNLTRRIPMVVQVDDTLYPSVPLEILRVMAGDPSYQMKVGETGIQAIRIPSFPTIPTDEHGRIWINQKHLFNEYEFIEDFPDFNGKTVIIGMGADSEGLVPILPTPRGLKTPQYIQASVLQTIINGENIVRPDYAASYEILTLAVLMILIIVITYKVNIYFVIFAVAGTFAGMLYGSFYVFDHHSILLDPSYPLLSGAVVFAQSTFNNSYRQYVARQQIKSQFGTYLSPALVKKLQDNPNMLKLGGERKIMSFLFCDIRGFTPISEQYKTDPEGLTELINRFLTPMTDIIIRNEGTIDKYMGDCIMALWNAPLDVDNHEDKALLSATQMIKGLDSLNAQLASENKLPINIGIGINTGSCVVGNMGSNQRFDYSVLGDAVNLASRLEGQSKNYGVTIVIGESTAQAIKNENFLILELDLIAVKGKEDPVKIYTCIESSGKVQDLTLHDTMLTCYRKGDISKAQTLCLELKGKFECLMDKYYDMMIQRCMEMHDNLPEDWDGVYRATTK